MKIQVLEQRKHILTLTRWYRAKYITNSDSKSHANFLCTGLVGPSQYASKEQTSERSMNTHGRAWEEGEEAGRESSLGYPLQPRQNPTQDSSVFEEHNIRQRSTEYRRTPSDQDFTESRDNLGPSPGSLVILIKLKCLSQPIRTENKKGFGKR